MFLESLTLTPVTRQQYIPLNGIAFRNLKLEDHFAI